MTVTRFRRHCLTIIIATLSLMPHSIAGVAQAESGTTSFEYITMSDGVNIAASVWYPPGFDDGDRGSWPALFVMDGYGGAGDPRGDFGFFGITEKYVVVYASIRGTGCSGGQFELFSERSALDGYEVIENWIVRQPWSNGRVGITGQSYSGITALTVASTNPPHAEAVAISGLVGDMYRDIVYRGGILNAGFPVLWAMGLRPASTVADNANGYASDETCARNLVEQGADNLVLDPALSVTSAATEPYATEGSWAVEKSLLEMAGRIRIPTEIDQQVQDQQTGPRGGYVLWEQIPDRVPKRLVIANGRHNPYNNNPHVVDATKGAWLDCWVMDRGRRCGQVNHPEHRVVTYYERRTGEGTNAVIDTEPITSRDWPPPETSWQHYYLDAHGELSPAEPSSDGATSYLSVSPGRHTSGGRAEVTALTFARLDDQARWSLGFAETAALNGPMVLTFWASSTSTDTDYFVDVLDRDSASGQLQYLQRGMVRASMSAVDDDRSDHVATGRHRGVMYRPYYPFLASDMLDPGSVHRFDVEIYPLTHVFRAGHELVVQVHAPPPSDALSVTDSYASRQPLAVNTILHGPSHPSNVLLPLQPDLPDLNPTPPACDELFGVPCLSPADERLPSSMTPR